RCCFFFSSRRRHTRFSRDWSSDVCSSDLVKSDLILTEVRQHILWITLNRPDKKNALTQDMYRALTSALQMAEQDQTIAAVVITGAGDSFTAGNDLHDFLAVEQLDDSAPPFQFLYTLSQLTVPVIAGVNGFAIGIEIGR